jgi:uncharacterized SAM-binding protein YcdF (DUF218 family)
MFTRYLLKTLALPPAINIVIILLALLFLGRWRRLRIATIFLSSVSLVLLSMPVVTQLLAKQIEIYPPLIVQDINPENYQAIVILGAGRIRKALEYDGQDSPTSLELERLRYGAYLQRKTGLPILTTGGDVSEEGRTPEADFMARVLEREFFATVTWKEGRSRTTRENAEYTRALASRQGINKVLLVTHAWHMRRAMYSFEQVGLRATAAPTRFESRQHDSGSLFDYLPTASSLHDSSLLIHEMLGLYWYRFVSVDI